MNSAMMMALLGFIVAMVVGLLFGYKYGVMEGASVCYVISAIVDIRYKLEVTP